MDKKRIIFAIVFGIMCIGIGYLLYRIFFYKAPIITPGVPIGTQPGQTFPQSGVGQGGQTIPSTQVLPTAGTRPGQQAVTTAVTPEVIVRKSVDVISKNPTSDKIGGAKFYNDTDGKYYRLMKDGSVQALSDETFFNVENTTWSPATEEAIIEYPDGSNIYYNFDTKKQVTLPKHWEDFSFSANGGQLASKSMGLAVENRWLVASSPDGKNIKLINELGENGDKVTVDWSPNQQIVALALTGSPLGADRQEVLFVGQNGENFKSTIVEGRGLTTQWSTTGNQLLYSVYSNRSDFKPELWIVNTESDSIGSNRRYLNLNTWSEKCTFADERFIFCAVPTSLPTGAGFAPELANSTKDNLYKIDLTTGLRTQLPTDGTNTIDTIFLSEDKKTIYFTDKNNIGLFQLNSGL